MSKNEQSMYLLLGAVVSDLGKEKFLVIEQEDPDTRDTHYMLLSLDRFDIVDPELITLVQLHGFISDYIK